MIMTDDSWHVVRNTRGVTGFVGPGSKPVALTDEEVAALGIDQRKPRYPFPIKWGTGSASPTAPITSFIGVVDEISESENRVRVIVSMFGRETPVELEPIRLQRYKSA